MVKVRCSCCRRYGNAKSKGTRPHGWKVLPVVEKNCCAECWKERYAVRALTFPISRPESFNGLPEGVEVSWPMLGSALRAAWGKTTEIANWAMHQLVKGDIVRTADMEKMPPMPKVYLYGLFSTQFDDRAGWTACAGNAQSVLRAVEQKYREVRFDIVWQRSEAVPTFKYPFPFPIHNQDWKPSEHDDGGACVAVNLPPFIHEGKEYPGGKWVLRLRGGVEFRRQLAGFRQILNGTAPPCEMAIYRGRSKTSSSRGTVKERDGLGNAKVYRPMAKLVAWFPRQDQSERKIEAMELRTDPNAFLVAELENSAWWVLNADHIRERWAQLQYHQGRQDAFRQRLAQDLKFEKRWPKDRRRKFLTELRAKCEKHERRVKSFIDEASACVVKYAVRRHVSTVIYDDTCQSFIAHFPWFQMKEKLSQKFAREGIKFHASGDNVAKNPAPAREFNEVES